MLTINGLLQALDVTVPPVEKDFELVEATIDSRQVIPGSLFIALPGERVDGHNFVQSAFSNGSLVALISQPVEGEFPILDARKPNSINHPLPEPPFCIRVDNTLEALQKAASYWRNQLDLQVIGITGSVGKSTTKECVFEVVRQKYVALKNPGNFNNEIGVPLTILQLTEAHQCAVLEMGFYVAGEIRFLCDLAKPQVGILTNVGLVHAERAGSQAAIAIGKAELVESLPSSGTAILNYDDPWVRGMKNKARCRVFSYGLSRHADLWADKVNASSVEKIELTLHHKGKEISLSAPLAGEHSAYTILRAASAGLALGLSWDEIIAGLSRVQSFLRMESFHTRLGGLLINDSYNASPESMTAALKLLSSLDGRKIAVLGNMYEVGIYETESHTEIGKIASQIVDELVVIGDKARIIGESAICSGMSPSKVTFCGDTGEATGALRDKLIEGTVTLLKGSHGLRMDRIAAELVESEDQL